MEIGSLAEWVEGGAEILAVSVALFLPYFQERRQNRAKNQRAKQVIISTAEQLLRDTNIKSDKILSELQGFVQVYSMLATNDKTIDIIAQGSAIIDVVGDSDALSNDQQQDIKRIIADLNDMKL